MSLDSPSTAPAPASDGAPHARPPALPVAQLSPNHAARATFVGGRWVSFRAAIAGVAHTMRTQPNAWIELAAMAVVALAGLWLRISALEWALLGLTTFLILALEAVNTAIEAVVDLVSPEWHPLARIAKDAAAGAMVFAVLGSIAVAAAIFLPKIAALAG